MEEDWQFGFHDNTPLGWLMTAGYFGVSALCGMAARSSLAPRASSRNRAFSWLILSLGMALLGLNKQLDFQTWLRFAGRDLSQNLGIYQHKAALRTTFLVLFAAAMLTMALSWRHRVQASLLRKPLLLSGLILLAIFILLRGLPSSQLERWNFLPVTRPEWHWTLEAGGLLLAACSAGTAVRRGFRG